MTCQQFIDIRGGDSQEHAILLCNYFTYIDKLLAHTTYKSYVVLGKAVPEGNAFFVLRMDTSAQNLNKVNCRSAGAS